MPLYECVFIARQDISGTQMESLIETFSNLIVEQGGQVPKKEYWGLKNLAYRIKKNRKGHYALLNLDAPPAAVQEMERTMKINEDVLRFLTVRVDELEEGPSAVMQGRGNREDRPRRSFGDRSFGDRGDRPFGDRGDRPFGDRGDRPSGGERPAGDGRALAGATE